MIAWCYEIVINCNSKYMSFVVVYVYFISMKNSYILFNYAVVILFMNFNYLTSYWILGLI